jgi:hypothetical protein
MTCSPLPGDSIGLRIQPERRVMEDIHLPIHPPADDQQPPTVDLVVEELGLEAEVDPIRILLEVDQEEPGHGVRVEVER